ncbi:cytochrome P450 [Streptomyces sp. TRM68416]|uniref:cytochrome P450 n=1 Tax=Streptomyces sp. TRM68416 TaxID=2758412 RepID=UPI001661C4BB|nr:cytochrome P450 [Streptomyces sp. TRM68416]MBD0844324.1 cytochrome P450 [Streptomyces sp. TRM68416]
MNRPPGPDPADIPALPPACPHRRDMGLPDGPRLTPAELHAMENERLLAAWEEYERTYGPLFTLHGDGTAPRVYISDPRAIRGLFIGNRTVWGARGTRYFRPVIGAQALPYLTGEAHRAVRLLLAPALHGDRVRALGPALDDIITSALDALRGTSVPLVDLTRDITLRLIVRVAFGPLGDERRTDCVRLLTEIMDLMYEPAASPDADTATVLRRVTGRVHELQELVAQEAGVVRAGEARHRDDLLFHLAAGEAAQTDEQIRGHIMTLLIAGHDTTAGVLAWALYQLELHPRTRRRVRAELDAIGAAPAAAEVVRLPYLNAVCAEALRHSSVVPAGLARIVPEDLEWAGHRFPAGTELVPAIHLVHRRPDLYPDPERFDPDRFLDRKPTGAHYLPFGTGSRRCPGAELAEFELPLALARLLQTPGLRLTGAEPGLHALKNGPTMTTPPSLRVALDDRASPQPPRGQGSPS